MHPTKAEVRFRDQSHIHEFVRRAFGDALGRGLAPELQLTAPGQGDSLAATLPLPNAYAAVFPSRWTTSGASRPDLGAMTSGLPTTADAGDPHVLADVPGVVSAPAGATMPGLKPLMPLGQFRDTFIIAVDEDGIAIIDQHVAHERVLFERITQRLTRGRLESQRLLEPMLVEMSADGRQALVAHADQLEQLGFEIEEFGGDTLRVSAFPAILSREHCSGALRALADDLDGLDRGAGIQEAVHKIAATMACHAAVKANYPLTAEKMAHILSELGATAYSTICPHGRPVMLRLTRREVERNFQRI